MSIFDFQSTAVRPC